MSSGGGVLQWVKNLYSVVITSPLDGSGYVEVAEQGTVDVAVTSPLDTTDVAVREQGIPDVTVVAPTDNSTAALETIDYSHHEIHSGSHFYLNGYTTLGANAGVDDTLYIKLVTPDSGRWSHFIFDINSTGILTSTFDEDATGGMTGGARVTIHANNRNTNCWTGIDTGVGNAAILTDSAQAWTVDALIGLQVFNTTDGSSGIITDNDATTVTATLAGGTDNDWDTGDTYEINTSSLVITSGVAVATSYTQRIDNDKWGTKGFKETIGGGSSREDELVLKQDTTYLRSFTSSATDNIVQFKASWYEHTNQ